MLVPENWSNQTSFTIFIFIQYERPRHTHNMATRLCIFVFNQQNNLGIKTNKSVHGQITHNFFNNFLYFEKSISHPATTVLVCPVVLETGIDKSNSPVWEF